MAPSSNHSMYIIKPETNIGVPTRPLGPTNLPLDIHPVSAPFYLVCIFFCLIWDYEMIGIVFE